MEIENDADDDGDGQQAEGDQRYEVDLVADALEIFNQLLLLEGVAVSGFADHFQLIFDTLEGGVLFDDLVAQLAVLGLERGQAVFDECEIDPRRGSGGRVMVRGEEVGVGGDNVSVDQGENALHERQRGTEHGHGALDSGRDLEWRHLRGADQGGAGRDGGGGFWWIAEGAGKARRAPAADRQG